MEQPMAGNISVSLGKGELAVAQLSHSSGATCEVYVHGGHLTSWKTSDGVERIFTSSDAIFQPGKAIRGGIPVCFPQFADKGPLKQGHGFARNSDKWELLDMGQGKENPTLVLGLTSDEDTKGHWDADFQLTLTFELQPNSVVQTMEVTNTGEAPCTFTTALHTYFRVPDVTEVQVQGLQGLSYEDKPSGGTMMEQVEEVVRFQGYTDRIYYAAPDSVCLTDQTGAVIMKIDKLGFPDVVVWNIGDEKVKDFKDMADSEWQEYACLEAAAIGSPVTVEGAASWKASQVFTAPTSGD